VKVAGLFAVAGFVEDANEAVGMFFAMVIKLEEETLLTSE
jgi:hypothetical protein